MPSPTAPSANRFVAAYDAKHAIARDGDTAQLTIGNDDFPFAFPIVKSGERWRFDTAAGKDELLARRIGENELDAIKVHAGDRRRAARIRIRGPQRRRRARVRAEVREQPRQARRAVLAGEGGRAAESARRARRARGRRGLPEEGQGPAPFHGYYYRLLKGQGKNAESGALDYVVHGRAIGGFAVVAWPAKYGNSGIMTFIVNQDGKVYQADLGPETSAKASKMQRFDPGNGWSPVAAK